MAGRFDVQYSKLTKYVGLLHQAELEYDRELTKIQQLNDRINREQERLDVLNERLEQLALLCLQSDESVTHLESNLLSNDETCEVEFN